MVAMTLDERIAAARAGGWECIPLNESGWWLAVDPVPVYNGLGQSEREAWSHILENDQWWPEIAKALGVTP